MDTTKLRELWTKATPGPLSIERRDDDGGGVDYVVYGPEGDFAICFDTESAGQAKRSAEWLVAMHSDMPALLDRLDALEAVAKTAHAHCYMLNSVSGTSMALEAALENLGKLERACAT